MVSRTDARWSFLAENQAVDFNIHVLSTAAWPLHPTEEVPTLPAELLKTRQRFIDFYNTKHR